VVRVEASRAQGELLHVQGPVHPGQDVIPRGESIRRGETILERGERVRPYHVGVLLAEGIGRLRVYDVRVSILPIGDDIRGPGRGPSGSTADLIGPVVARLFDFAAVRLLPPIPDDPARLRRAIASEVRRSDLLITIGGASVGARDVTKSTLSGMGEILFEGVRANVMKRGAVALVQRTPVLVLPGQIVSAVTNSHEHGLHLVGRMAGSELRRREFATLSEPVEVNHRMDSTYLFRVHDGQADPLPWGVARWSALLEANAFGVLPRGRRWAAGDRVELQWLESGGTAGPLGS
jgi:molybdopterin molybdotransferase